MMENAVHKRSPWKIAAIILAILLGLAAIMALIVRNRLHALRNDYTSDVARELPEPPRPSSTQKERLNNAYQTLSRAYETGKTASIQLPADDFAAYFAFAPETAPLAKDIRLSIHDDILTADMALPLDMLGLPFLKKRVFNGTFNFHIAADNGQFDIKVLSGVANGKELTPTVLKLLNKFDWNQYLADQYGREWMPAVKRLAIQDSTFFLTVAP